MVNFKNNLCFILILFSYISTGEYMKGIYLIKPINKYKKSSKKFSFSQISSKNFNIYVLLFDSYIRMIPIESDIYNIEIKLVNKKLTLDNENNLKLISEISDIYGDNIFWKIIKINDDEYLIQNNSTKNFLEANSYRINCTKDISDIVVNKDYQNISDNFKFKFIKLYEEPEINEEYLKYIDEEPVDVVIKYIDLSDKTLNREGIHQIPKDEEHEELRYSVRSVFENIPWFRKIFIVMPNENVKYFKPIEDIKDRIAYVKDKDVIGFDTASNLNFHLRLWNLAKFNVSDNIILMDDDCFIGKPIKKSDFFYYDEEQKKVLPNIVSNEFKELNKEFIYKEYNNYFSLKDKINPHTSNGWHLQSYTSFKLLLDNYPQPLIDAGFTHNAISLNIQDVKEIYDLIQEKYQYANEILNSKERTVYDIQFQTLYNSYALNIKKRKAHPIPRKFIDLNQLKKRIDLDVELFVINTSGENNYSSVDFKNLKKILEYKFVNPTEYEINTNISFLFLIFYKIKKIIIQKNNLRIFLIILINIFIIIILKKILKIICNMKSVERTRRSHKIKHKMYRSDEYYYLKNY